MAINIGPRIQVEGENEYRSQINSIIQQTKTLKAEMTATSSAFEKGAKGLKGLKSNMEQAQAKAKNLNEQIKLQKERVEAVKNMTQQAAAKYGEADIKTLKWRESLAGATAELNKMEAELKAVPSNIQLIGQAMEETGEKIKEVGSKIQDVGKSMTTHVTAPIMAVGAAAIKAFNDVDAGYDAIIKKTGASGEALDEMQGIVDNIATSIPSDFETVGNAVGEVSTRFGVTGEELETLSTQFLQFAELNDTDVTTSVDTVQNALAAFNLSASDAGTVMDVLNATGQATGASAEKMASSIVENATAFQQMGMDIYESIDFMGKFETAGADSSSVLSGMKRALKSATEQGIPFDKALADLEDTIINGTDDMDGLSAAYDLFGKSGAAVYQAVSNGQISFTDFADSVDILDASVGSVSDTFTATQDPIDQWKTTLNSLKLAGASLGATIGTVLVPIMNTVKNVVMTLKEKWDALSPSTQEAIVKAALIAAAIGPVITVVGKVTSGVGGLISGVGKVTTLISKFSMVLSPTTLIIAGVVAAIVAIIAVIKNWGAIVDWIKGVWTSLKTTVSNVWTSIKTTISNAMTSVKTTISNAWTSVKTTISNALTGAYNTVVNKFNSIKTAITNKLNAAKTAVSNVITGIKNLFNFSWSLPKLKLPHFSFTGGFSLHPLSLPHISVSWYKKAYDNPMMFKSPTVLATSNGLKGFGDGNGAEIVIGQSMMYKMIKGAVQDVILPSGSAGGVTVNVYGAEGQDVRELARLVSLEINADVSGRRAVWA